MKGLFLVGTDTGVGKTTVGVGLLRLARRRHFRLVPFKPVETGCTPEPLDATRLRDAAALPDLALADICPYPLPVAVAPSVAFRLANSSISPETILKQAAALALRADALLIESAGGLLTPYGPGITAASLAELLDITILLVSANRLGTINHTALAFSELRRRRVRLAGILLVNISPHPSADQPFNAAEIEQLTGLPPLGTLRHCPTDDPDAIADALASDIYLGTLLEGALI